jgi:hypothetical protein
VCLLIAVICTLLYRQKMVWLKRLERFRFPNRAVSDNMSQDARDESEEAKAIRARHTDFWELSWDRLIIKSEKLGSGAYGQVFRGTIIGRPPCYEKV